MSAMDNVMTSDDVRQRTFLGFDLSTQRLKGIQLNSKLEIIASAEVQFDTDLPEFRTTGGVSSGDNKNEFFVQPVMWVKAVDIICDRLVMDEADLSTVAAIGGSAQQHGSIFWSHLGIERLKNLDPEKFLHSQIDDSAFVITRTPIWMDSSTGNQCLEMETAIGGRSEMVAITGSKCYPRFTGPQIRKIYQQRAHAYEDAKRISLISSFLASIFLGDVAPIDYADASGMNLFAINTKCWSKVCLNACAPDLAEKLGNAVPTNSIIGNINQFFVQRFGIPSTCKVAAFSGDNPSALTGMLIKENWLVISLGTSDTMMMNIQQQPKLDDGHVMCHPIENDAFMGLLCFRNGSLVRDALKVTEANNCWKTFSELLDSTPRGNYGNMALHFVNSEIIPHAKGVLRWGKTHSASSQGASKGILKFNSPETEIRALIEGQMLHKRVVATDMGFHFSKETKIIATGGASINKSILQVISDVFNAPVYVQKDKEAALMGAAYRANYALFLHERNVEQRPLSYFEYIEQLIPNRQELACLPSNDSEQIYEPMLDRYRQMVRILESRK